MRPRNRELGKAVAAMETQQASSEFKLAKKGQYRWHDFVDKWFRTKDGEVVVAQTPNALLIIFMITGIFAVVSFQGFWHTAAELIAVISITLWGILERRSGVNRFRRLLGAGAIVSVIIVLILYFWN